jgi:hypothetical protein
MKSKETGARAPESSVSAQWLAEIMAGNAAMLSELIRLLIQSGAINKSDVVDALTELSVKAKMSGQGPGVTALPSHVLRILNSNK